MRNPVFMDSNQVIPICVALIFLIEMSKIVEVWLNKLCECAMLIDMILFTNFLAVVFYPCNMSRVMRKPAFCICENKDADQLRVDREADQRLYFRYTASIIPLLSKSKLSSL